MDGVALVGEVALLLVWRLVMSVVIGAAAGRRW